MHSVMSAQTTEFDDSIIDNAIHTSMQQKACCDQCNDDCAECSTGLTSCERSLNHVSAFVLFNQYASQSLSRIQFSIEPFIQYHNQIITPDFRPPIV